MWRKLVTLALAVAMMTLSVASALADGGANSSETILPELPSTGGCLQGIPVGGYGVSRPGLGCIVITGN
jgi:hypothetical protein